MAEYKDVTSLKAQIADVKRAINSPNSDYMTGYICALSVTEGIIAGLPTADVVEVVRCKDCKRRKFDDHKLFHKCTRDNLWHDADDFCSHGEGRLKE